MFEGKLHPHITLTLHRDRAERTRKNAETSANGTVQNILAELYSRQCIQKDLTICEESKWANTAKKLRVFANGDQNTIHIALKILSLRSFTPYFRHHQKTNEFRGISLNQLENQL